MISRGYLDGNVMLLSLAFLRETVRKADNVQLD
jgi:hypothetical protein